MKIEELELKKGGHKSIEEGVCIMEAVAMLANEEWSDHPSCACPVISAFLRSWNDTLNDEDRQQLKKYIPLLIGSKATNEIEAKRAMYCVDWTIRVYVPKWLRLAKLVEHAEKFENKKEIFTKEDFDSFALNLYAAGNAAESVAGSVAWSAAWSAAGNAADSAAWSAAGNAARSAARSAADSAARSAADSAAWNAAWSAADSAAWSAAGNAARSALLPTVKELQLSAHELIEKMLALK